MHPLEQFKWASRYAVRGENGGIRAINALRKSYARYISAHSRPIFIILGLFRSYVEGQQVLRIYLRFSSDFSGYFPNE